MNEAPKRFIKLSYNKKSKEVILRNVLFNKKEWGAKKRGEIR